MSYGVTSISLGMHLQDKIEELQAQIEAATAESAELAKRNTQWEAELQVFPGILQLVQS